MPASLKKESLHFKKITDLSKVLFQFQLIMLTVICVPEKAHCQPNNTKTNSPEIRLITPQPTAPVDTDRPVIMFFLFDEDGDLKLNSIILTLDETNVTRQAQISQTMVTFVPSEPLENGEHTISLAIADSAGNRTGPLQWRFHVFLHKPALKEKLSLRSRLSFESRIKKQHQGNRSYFRPFDIQRLKFSTTGNWKGFRFKYSMLLNNHFSSEARGEARQLQPINRYRFYVQRKGLKIFLCDHTPYLSPLTLSYTRIRGITLNWHYKRLKTALVLGKIARNVYRTKLFRIEQNDSSKTLHQVTYSRYAVGINAGFIIIKNLKLQLNLLKIFDVKEQNDLMWSFSPKENLVTSLGFEWRLPKLKTTLSAETAHSILIHDRWAEKDNDLSDYSSLIPHWLIDVNRSIQTTLRFKYKDLLPHTYWVKSRTQFKNTSLLINLRNIPMQFSTLGNPGLPVDTRELTINNRWNFLMNKLFFNINFKYLINNLRPRTKLQTSQTWNLFNNFQYWVNPSFAVQAGFLHLSQKGWNSHDSVHIDIANNSLNYLNLGTTIKPGEHHNIQLNGFYSISENSSVNISKYNSYQITTNHRLSHRLSVSLGMNWMNNNFLDYSNLDSSFLNYNYRNYRFHVYYFLPNNKLRINLGANMNRSQDRDGEKFRQFYFNSGIRAMLTKKSTVSLNMQHALKSNYSASSINFRFQTSF